MTPTSPAKRWITDPRHLGALVVAAIGGPLACVAAWKLTFAPLARDQGTFQYIAWALAQGQRDYRDLRDFSGPLIHFVHLLFLPLGSADEHAFRSIDLIVNAAVFCAAGALLADLLRPGSDTRGPGVALRTGWGVAVATVLMAQYVRFGWWSTAQRESYYTLFLLLATALQLHAQGAPGRRRAALVLAGACSALPWFGKPTNVLFTVLQGLALVAAQGGSVRRDLVALAAGVAAGCGLMLALLAVWGDIGGFFRIVVVEIPSMYLAIDRLSWRDAVLGQGNLPIILAATITVVGLAVGLITRRVPARLVALLVLPFGGLVTFFFQAKGFLYHLHAASAGMHLAWLGLVMHAAARAGPARTRIALAGAGLLGVCALGEARLSEPYRFDWPRWGGSPEQRAGETYFSQFQTGAFYAWDMRRAAAFVAAHTSPRDRVQTYGIDPYFLFLARRLSATPYLYNFELNVAASLRGGSGGVPSDAERREFDAAARRRQLDLVGRLEANPPAAFVLFDLAPFTYPPDAVADLERHVAPVAGVLRARYREAARFGTVRVWFRNDLPVRPSDPHGAASRRDSRVPAR